MWFFTTPAAITSGPTTLNRSKVSSHYLIARDGRIYYLVDELARAWHAGESYWGGNRDLNSASIGIELDNNGGEPFAEAQIEALIALLADLKARYGIPTANFIGHGDVAPGRKVEPSRWFPWQGLAGHGFGLWCEPPYPPAPPDLDSATLLAAFGYDVAAATMPPVPHDALVDTSRTARGGLAAQRRCPVSRSLINLIGIFRYRPACATASRSPVCRFDLPRHDRGGGST